MKIINIFNVFIITMLFILNISCNSGIEVLDTEKHRGAKGVIRISGIEHKKYDKEKASLIKKIENTYNGLKSPFKGFFFELCDFDENCLKNLQSELEKYNFSGRTSHFKNCRYYNGRGYEENEETPGFLSEKIAFDLWKPE